MVRSCQTLTVEARRKLYGKPASFEEILQETYKLLSGDKRLHKAPLSMIDTARKLGWDRQTVWRDLKKGIKLNLIPTDEQGNIIFDKISEDEEAFVHFGRDVFEKDEMIRLWVEDMRDRKGGKGIKSWRKNLGCVRRLCNTLKIKPYQLAQDRESYKQYIQSFKRALENGEDKRDTKTGIKSNNIQTIVHTVNMGCRSFAQFHGVSFIRGTDDITSGKVVNHGQYKDIRLSLDEIKRAEQYIIDTWGLDSDIFRIFTVGIESGARMRALLDMECNWTETLSKNGTVTFHMKAYESNTDDNWAKFIRRPLTQESLKMQQAKNARLIWNAEEKTEWSQINIIKEQLREVYTHLGKANVNNGYFIRKPFHTMRHIAAQYWILITDGDLTLTRKACGWRHDIELEASYGELPPQLIQKKLDALDVIA